MNPPLVAIVGRPNVGKSTLFNRLAGQRLSIVEDSPGVTRDRLYADAEWFGRLFSVVDTGGYEPQAVDQLYVGMREQARIAVEEAAVICLVVDGPAGLMPDDEEIARYLRRSGKPLVVAVNKIDGAKHEPQASDFYPLGVEELFLVSSAHGRGITDLVDRLLQLLPVVPADGAEEDDALQVGGDEQSEPERADVEHAEDRFEGVGEGGAELPSLEVTTPQARETRVSFIGRPNVGKSTLVNRLLGQPRCLVSDEPGTTRDPIDSELSVGDRVYHLIDTAGLRRKSRIKLDLERYTAIRSLRAIDRSHVICFLVDAQAGLSDQDQRIAAYAARQGRATLVLLNKWDLVEDKSRNALTRMIEQFREDYSFLVYAPVLAISARTGRGVDRILPTIDLVRRNHLTRVRTAPLNRLFQEIAEAHHPPLYRGQPVKMYYISQPRVAPPTFVISCNHPEGVPDGYRRYIENRLRERFPFTGTPLRLDFQRRKETPARS